MTRIPGSERTFILQAMVSMAAVDGEIDARERATICSLYARMTGEAVSADEISRAPCGPRARGLTFAGQLARARHRLSEDVKETILRGAYMVLLADGRIGARERSKLSDFVNALDICEIHRGVIFEEVERTLH